MADFDGEVLRPDEVLSSMQFSLRLHLGQINTTDPLDRPTEADSDFASGAHTDDYIPGFGPFSSFADNYAFSQDPRNRVPRDERIGNGPNFKFERDEPLSTPLSGDPPFIAYTRPRAKDWLFGEGVDDLFATRPSRLRDRPDFSTAINSILGRIPGTRTADMMDGETARRYKATQERATRAAHFRQGDAFHLTDTADAITDDERKAKIAETREALRRLHDVQNRIWSGEEQTPPDDIA